MGVALLTHISAGGLALAAGYIALYAPKGRTLHRKSGMLFVYAMLVMAFFGALVTVLRDAVPALNLAAAVLTAYLVITALITVRPLPPTARWAHTVLMLVALAVGLNSLRYGVEAIASPDGTRNGMPAFPFFLFGMTGTLAALSDVRVIRFGDLRGTARLARHLWRMCFALFIAALSFFIGQANVLPQALRIPILLALPVLAVLVTMLYWVWRVRSRRATRVITIQSAAAIPTPTP